MLIRAAAYLRRKTIQAVYLLYLIPGPGRANPFKTLRGAGVNARLY